MSDVDKDRIQIRIRKLFQLSESSNENEAAAALGAANRLMREYGITEIDISEEIEFAEVLLKQTRAYKWEIILALSVAEIFCCRLITNWKGIPSFIGTDINIKSAEIAFDRISKWAKLRGSILCSRFQINKREEINNYLSGVAYGIAQRISEISEKIVSSKALVPVVDKIDEHLGDIPTSKVGEAGKSSITRSYGFLDAKEAPLFSEVNNQNEPIKVIERYA